MTAKNYAAKGLQLQMGDGATPTEAFTAIANLGDLTGPGAALDTVEVTHHGSPAKEFAATLLDGGEVSLSINWDPAEATHKNAAGGLIYVMEQKTLKNWKIVTPDTGASVVAFSAFVVGFEPEGPVAGKLAAKVKLRISGAVTFP
jgi:predicted secreted protein